MRAEELKEPLRHFKKEFTSTVDEVKSSIKPGSDSSLAEQEKAASADEGNGVDQH
jgi:hypothetical protein